LAQNLKIIEVSAGIIRNGDDILLAQRPPGSRHAGFWEFPGGKFEDGETPESCLKRELIEELELEIQSPRVVFKYEHSLDRGILLRLYFIECYMVAGSSPKPVHGQGIVWLPPAGLLDFQLLEPDRAAVEFLAGKHRNQ
jgi:8-oxo-dGTP diphosphatase